MVQHAGGGGVSGTSSHFRRQVGQGCPWAICMGGAPFVSGQVCSATCGACGGARLRGKSSGGPGGPGAARSQEVGRRGPSFIRLRLGSCSGEGPGRRCWGTVRAVRSELEATPLDCLLLLSVTPHMRSNSYQRERSKTKCISMTKGTL